MEPLLLNWEMLETVAFNNVFDEGDALPVVVPKFHTTCAWTKLVNANAQIARDRRIFSFI